jgi:hypothetical protein
MCGGERAAAPVIERLRRRVEGHEATGAAARGLTALRRRCPSLAREQHDTLGRQWPRQRGAEGGAAAAAGCATGARPRRAALPAHGRGGLRYRRTGAAAALPAQRRRLHLRQRNVAAQRRCAHGGVLAGAPTALRRRPQRWRAHGAAAASPAQLHRWQLRANVGAAALPARRRRGANRWRRRRRRRRLWRGLRLRRCDCGVSDSRVAAATEGAFGALLREPSVAQSLQRAPQEQASSSARPRVVSGFAWTVAHLPFGARGRSSRGSDGRLQCVRGRSWRESKPYRSQPR